MQGNASYSHLSRASSDEKEGCVPVVLLVALDDFDST